MTVVWAKTAEHQNENIYVIWDKAAEPQGKGLAYSAMA